MLTRDREGNNFSVCGHFYAWVDFICLPADGTRVGILLTWRSNVCKLLTSRVDAFSISAQFDLEESSPWWFTGVYGRNPITPRYSSCRNFVLFVKHALVLG